MEAQTPRLARVRGFELSARAFLVVAVASAVSLYLIVVSGAVVRLTASGLGCESWPGCQPGAFFPESGHHSWVEFGNRIVALFPITLTLVAWLAARRTSGLPRWVAPVALGTFLGTIGQAPLGLVTILSDLDPLLVASHFLLALVVLAGGIVVALAAWGRERGAVEPVVSPAVRRAGLVLAAACAVLVVTGTLSTAAGPHSGGADIDRLGNLVDAVYVHVRATAVFGIFYLVVLWALFRRRAQAPGLFGVGLLLLGLLLVQMAVGEIQWRNALPWGVVLVHVALAAAIWAVTVALAALLWRPVAPLVRDRP
jgi:cytochrome c oxidase assembly protein subunit 15